MVEWFNYRLVFLALVTSAIPTTVTLAVTLAEIERGQRKLNAASDLRHLRLKDILIWSQQVTEW